MNQTLDQLGELYASVLREYLAGGGEDALKSAYEVGRKAIAARLGVLDMATIHQRALAAVLSGTQSSDAPRLASQATGFLAESLSPFEMALLGFQEANGALRRNIEELAESRAELQRQNEKLEQANTTVESERRRYRELFEFAPDGYLVTDLDGRIRESNTAAAQMFGVRREFLAAAFLSLFLADEEHKDFDRIMERLRDGQDQDTGRDWLLRMQRHAATGDHSGGRSGTGEGSTFPAAVTIGVVRGSNGEPAGLRWLLRDVTDRKREDEERAQLRIREQVARAEVEGVRRLEFLATASSILNASLEYETTLARQAQLSVPFLADWCVVWLAEGEEQARPLVVVHAEPEKAPLANHLLRSLSATSPVPASIATALAEGQSEIIHDPARLWPYDDLAQEISTADEKDSSNGADASVASLIRRMGFQSAMVVPLIARGRTMGALTFVGGARRYGATDLTLAQDLSGRCALAVDNARLYRQVVIERDRAEKASRAKDEFVAILSHELRNPLMPILGWARVFKNQPALMRDNVLGEGVKSLERNAQTVARLVEDCLDLARISARKITLERELLDMNEVVEGSVEAVRERVEDKGLNLKVELAPTGLWLLGDRTRLGQAVTNLLTNAVRYTDSGGVIAVRACRAEAEAEVEVKDTGVGIASDFLDQIFEPFRQATSQWLTAESGLGLGLAIVKQIVQAHGGRILAESRGRGYGSTFRLRLPLTVTQDIAAAAGKTAEEPRIAPAALPLRILVIEDSPDILALIKINLEGVGYIVTTAQDGETGLRAAESERPDLIVSDIKIPGIDGYELIRRVRTLPGMQTTPAVAMTGFGMKKDIEDAMEAGYNAHLTKPVEIEELCAVIEKLRPRSN